MSILSADHTIYSFITLCLKEQGDIAGRKEITALRRGRWEKSRMPSSTETYLCDRFTAQEQSFYLGVSPSSSLSLPEHPPVHPEHTQHIYSQTAAHEKAAPCGRSEIQFPTYPRMIGFTLLFSSFQNIAAKIPF